MCDCRANSTLQDPQVVSGLLTDVAKYVGNLKFNVWKKMMDLITYCEYIAAVSVVCVSSL